MNIFDMFCLEIGKNLFFTSITLLLLAIVVLIPIFIVKVAKSS